MKNKKIVLLMLYIVSLFPLCLPWFGFDREIDGLRSGIETINNIILIALVILMVVAIFFIPASWQKIGITIVLMLHCIVYAGYFLFWYVPLITNFNIITSFETAHIGFYLTIILNILLIKFYKNHYK